MSEQEQFYSALNAIIQGFAYGFIVILAWVVVYFLWHEVRERLERVRQKMYYEQHKNDPKPKSLLNNETVYHSSKEPIKMQSGKNGLRWGGNTYTVKKK